APDDGPLTTNEMSAWDERLGAQTDTASGWGQIVGDYLFNDVPAERRVAHLAHALRYYPFFPKTPAERFVEEQMSDVEWRTRCNDIGGSAEIEHATNMILELKLSAEDAAAKLLEVLDPLGPRGRAVLLALMIYKRRLSYVGFPEPRKTSTLTAEDVDNIVREEREAVVPVFVALAHIGCGHTSPTDVGNIVVNALEKISDSEHKAVVLGFLLQQLANSGAHGEQPSGMPQGIAELLATLGRAAIGQILPWNFPLPGGTSMGSPAASDDEGPDGEDDPDELDEDDEHDVDEEDDGEAAHAEGDSDDD
ncbi:MAG: hypothetical protein Q7S02_04595, partial [bacterium]|nr:hypothetical protein [bacterium]